MPKGCGSPTLPNPKCGKFSNTNDSEKQTNKKHKNYSVSSQQNSKRGKKELLQIKRNLRDILDQM